MTNIDLKNLIRTVDNYPHEGIQFRDVTTLLKDKDGFAETIDLFVKRYSIFEIDIVAGIEARGFIVGAALAQALGLGFVPIRKAGKLPAEVYSQDYALEYGTDVIEIHRDAIPAGSRVLIVDDLIATGGTAEAAAKLIERAKASVVEFAFVIDLPELGGAEKLRKSGYCVNSLIEFSGK